METVGYQQVHAYVCCVCTYMHMCDVCEFGMGLHVLMCMHAHVYICTCVCVWYGVACAHVYACTCVHMHVCVCVWYGGTYI